MMDARSAGAQRSACAADSCREIDFLSLGITHKKRKARASA